MESVKLAPAALEAMLAHARATHPAECCGAVVEVEGRDVVRRFTNIQDRLHAEDPVATPRGAETAYTRTFSYGAELATPDIALSVLVRCLEAVRKVRKHGIAKGPWAEREEWINGQIAARGARRGLPAPVNATLTRLIRARAGGERRWSR